MSGEESAVWVNSAPTVDGSAYVVTLEADDDTAITFDRDRAATYALGVLDAAHRAAYDAAVFRQMTVKLGMGQADAAHVVVDLRQDRPPLASEPAAPLELDPGVNDEGRPFLGVLVNGKRVGQWTVEDARQHALHVLESVVVADLDAGYYRALTGLVGVDDTRARQAVADIAEHRPRLDV